MDERSCILLSRFQKGQNVNCDSFVEHRKEVLIRERSWPTSSSVSLTGQRGAALLMDMTTADPFAGCVEVGVEEHGGCEALPSAARISPSERSPIVCRLDSRCGVDSGVANLCRECWLDSSSTEAMKSR